MINHDKSQLIGHLPSPWFQTSWDTAQCIAQGGTGLIGLPTTTSQKNTRLWSPGFSEKRDRAFKIITNSSWNEGYIQLHNVIEIDLKFHPQIDTKLTREKCMLIFPQLVNPRNKKQQGAHQIHVVGQSFPWTVHQKNMLFARHLSSNRDVSEINQFC